MRSFQRLEHTQVLPFAIFTLIILSRIVSVADGRDPGVDQAALMSNFPLAGLDGLFRPLPYFEQVTSLGSAIELNLLSGFFGVDGIDRFVAARLIAAMAALSAYFLIYRILRPRFSYLEIALVLALLASSKEILLFTTNPKHYVFELLAACLLMRAALAYLERPGMQETVVFLGATLLAAVLAITAPLIVVIVGSGMLAATLARRSPSDSAPLWPDLLRLGVLGLAAIGICGVFYLGYTRPVAFYQIAAFAYEYEVGLMNLRDPFSPESLGAVRSAFRVFYRMVEPAYTVEVLLSCKLLGYRSLLSYVAAMIALLGYVEYWRRSPFLAGGLTGGLIVFIVLNLMGMLPFTSTRHFMFFAPVAVPAFVLGLTILVTAMLRAMRLTQLASPVLAVFAIAVVAAGVRQSSSLENTEVSAHLDMIEATPAATWIYYGAQPSVRSLRPDLLDRRDPPILGLIPHASGTKTWGLAARTSNLDATLSKAFMERAKTELSGTEPLWMLFANHWPEQADPAGLDHLIAASEADGRRCRVFLGVNSMLAYCALPGAMPLQSGTN